MSAEETALPAWLCDRIDVFRGRPLEVVELSGGLTNRNFKVTTPDAAYVVRRSTQVPGGLVINRDHEYRNSTIAAATGVGAPVVAYLPDEATMVIGFLEGRTLTDADFSRPGIIERVAGSCRQLHQGGRFVNDFDMFAIQRGYLRTVLDRGLPAARGVPRVRAPAGPDPPGAGRCDRNPRWPATTISWPGTSSTTASASASSTTSTAGNNDACFELGNIASECHLTDDQLDLLVASYYGRRLVSKEARARLQGLMSQYGWTLWASIQQATSDDRLRLLGLGPREVRAGRRAVPPSAP